MSVRSTITAVICASTAISLPCFAGTTDFNAGAVMAKMSADEHTSYIAGVVEGLAYARYAQDNKNIQGDQKSTVGMQCIYDWFYKNKDTIGLIDAAFERYPQYPPGVIVASLEKKVCGD